MPKKSRAFLYCLVGTLIAHAALIAAGALAPFSKKSAYAGTEIGVSLVSASGASEGSLASMAEKPKEEKAPEKVTEKPKEKVYAVKNSPDPEEMKIASQEEKKEVKKEPEKLKPEPDKKPEEKKPEEAQKKVIRRADRQTGPKTVDGTGLGGSLSRASNARGSGAGSARGGTGAGAKQGAALGSGAGLSSSASKALVLKRVQPRYPLSARRRGIEGKTAVLVEVLPDGRAGRVSLGKSSGVDAFDRSALEAVRQWVFAPYREGGRALSRTYSVDVIFSLGK